MLLFLDIQDFGLIERVSMEFTSGLNVLTGETGTGKSIIIEAIQVVLGQRASTEFIRSNREKAIVSAIFDISRYPDVQQLLATSGIPLEPEENLLMVRELTRTGRNLCRINGQMVTLNLYREIGHHLVDLHGQHEQQSLLNPQRQKDLLDLLGSTQLLELREKVSEYYKQWCSAKTQLEGLLKGVEERNRRLSLLRYQLEEIDAAQLSLEEEEKLEKERGLLANAEKIIFLAEECYRCLYGDENREACAVNLLGEAVRILRELSRLDEQIKTLMSIIESVLYQVEDVARDLADYRVRAESDPAKLQFVEERLALIRTLKRKYGNSIFEVLRYRERIAAEIEMLQNQEENLASLEKKVTYLEKAWQETADSLTRERRKAATLLEQEVSKELASLQMGKVEFCVFFEKLSEPSVTGQDKIEFLISPNPGEPLRSLSRTASGGELSRIMLAIRTVLSSLDDIPTLVFDEVDTGIGGRALRAVAEKLARIAAHSQVICVTHAAQVACYATTHFHVIKEVRGNETITHVKLLQEEMRLKELARMLAGEVEGLAAEHARQMLEQARSTGLVSEG